MGGLVALPAVAWTRFRHLVRLLRWPYDRAAPAATPTVLARESSGSAGAVQRVPSLGRELAQLCGGVEPPPAAVAPWISLIVGPVGRPHARHRPTLGLSAALD